MTVPAYLAETKPEPAWWTHAIAQQRSTKIDTEKLFIKFQIVYRSLVWQCQPTRQNQANPALVKSHSNQLSPGSVCLGRIQTNSPGSVCLGPYETVWPCIQLSTCLHSHYARRPLAQVCCLCQQLLRVWLAVRCCCCCCCCRPCHHFRLPLQRACASFPPGPPHSG
jgi:hypothetical protein